MDWTPLAQIATTAACAAATLTLPVATGFACRWLSAHRYGKYTSAIASTGGAIAYSALTAANANGGAPDWAAAKAAAIAAAIPLVQKAEAKAAAVITDPAALHALVTAGLGKLEAMDPTVPAGNGSTATATGAGGAGAAAEAGVQLPSAAATSGATG